MSLVQTGVGAQSKKSVYSPAHQSCPAEHALPKYWYINPLQSPAGAWQGSQVTTEYELDQNIGLVKDFGLQVQLSPFTIPAQAPNLPPTPFWLSYIEILLGADLLETV